METPPLAPEAEKLIEIQTQLLHQANLKLDRRALQLQAAAEVSRATGSILDPDELIHQVVELTRERFGLYYVGLYLVDQTDGAGKWAVLRAGTGEAGRQMVAQGRRIEVGGDSMIGWCIANRQSRLEEDITEEAAIRKNPLLPATRSKLALPLISRGQAIGAMTFQSAQPKTFTEEDITTLQTMADQLANAIENARLFSELKRAQEALAEHARQLEETTTFLDSVVENVPLMFFVKDASDLRWVRWNKAGADTIGLSREELIGKTDYDVFPKEEADFFTRQDREALTSGRLVDTPEEPVHTRHKGVRILHTLKVPILDAEGKPQYLLGLSEDVTERKRAEEEASRTRAFLDSVIENIPLFVFVKNAEDLSVVLWNRAGAETVGYSREEMIGKNDYDFFTREEADFFRARRPGSVGEPEPAGYPRRAHSHPAPGRQTVAHAQGADPRCGRQAAISDGHLRGHHRTQTRRGGGQPHPRLPGFRGRKHPDHDLRQGCQRPAVCALEQGRRGARGLLQRGDGRQDRL